jgi:hypothetical protein
VRNNARDPRLPDEIRAYNGTITVGVREAARTYRDANGAEEWLIAQAREQGHGGVLDAFRGQSRT